VLAREDVLRAYIAAGGHLDATTQIATAAKPAR
jgi:hypothetical protein